MAKTKKLLLPEEQLKCLLKQLRVSYTIVNDIMLYTKKYSRYSNVEYQASDSKTICYCEKNNGAEINYNFCPYCGNGIYKNIITIYDPKCIDTFDNFIKENEEVDASNYNNTYARRTISDSVNIVHTLYNGFYISKHPEYDNGIIIYKLNLTVKGINATLDPKIERIIELIPGVHCKGYKIVRGEKKEIDLFDAFNLSSHTKRYDVQIVWEESNGMIDFMLKHKLFSKETAFFDVFNNLKLEMHRNSLFFIYMYLYSQYPVIELLAKMGYIKLITNVINSVASSCNKTDMHNVANDVEKVLNPHSTKGSLSLNIPRYIGDYLNYCGANYHEYETWVDICEFETLSKENFFKLVQSPEFCYLRSIRYGDPLKRIINLLKYGYTIEKLIKYIYKISIKEKISIDTAIDLLNDYRYMLEIMEITPEEYPSKLKSTHDNVASAYSDAKNELDNKAIAQIAADAKDFIPEDEKLTIILPVSVQDFVDEGQRQHNCVASYTKRVLNKTCVVFFIRRKEEPSMNYVTAEYRNGHLYQIKEKNNYSVTDPDVITYANKFCSALSKSKFFKGI